MILARGNVLGLADLELPHLARQRPAPDRPRPRGGQQDERQQIEQALAAAKGRVYGEDGAAAALGLAPSTLDSRIRRLGIDKLAFRRRPSIR